MAVNLIFANLLPNLMTRNAALAAGGANWVTMPPAILYGTNSQVPVHSPAATPAGNTGSANGPAGSSVTAIYHVLIGGGNHVVVTVLVKNLGGYPVCTVTSVPAAINYDFAITIRP
jgi:hypothetical protein